jgi:hypothetical protein
VSARRRIRTAFGLALAFAPLLSACGDRDADELETPRGTETPAGTEGAAVALRVSELELGNAIGADRRIVDTAVMDEFGATDTIYAAVDTEGAASGATLTARWTYQDGQVVDESTQTISPTGPAVTEFHISRPGGFPPGDYQVEILLDGRSVERKSFEVR